MSAENSEPILLFFLPALPSDSDRGGSASPPSGPGPVTAVVGPPALVPSAAAPGSGVGAVTVAGTGSGVGAGSGSSALVGCGSAAGVSSSCLAAASAGGVDSPPRASAPPAVCGKAAKQL